MKSTISNMHSSFHNSVSTPVQQKQQGKQQRQKRDWREYLYNCPYLILITLTSLAVMFVSNEIGIA